MSITAEWRNLDETIAKYARIEREMPQALTKTMTRAVIYSQGQIPAYPSPPAGSTYRRTGSLGRVVTAFPGHSGPRNIGGGGGDRGGTPLTRVETIAGGVRGVIGGRLEYLPGVISEGEQDRVHVGRWWTLQKVIRDAKGGIIKLFRADFTKLFD